MATKGKLNKWDITKLKSNAQAKKPSTKVKGKLLNGSRYLQ